MSQRMGVAKAARILGVNRDALQQLIRSGELTTFEGQVDLDELRHCFPGLEFNRRPVLEKMQIIKDQAFSDRVQMRVMPSAENLQQQIRRLKVDLGIERTKARKYQSLIEDLLEKMAEMHLVKHAADEDTAAQLNDWLLERFKK